MIDGQRDRGRSGITTDDPRRVALLLRAARRGDREAFRALYDLHRTMVHNVAFHLLGSGDLALDVSQEVFLRLFERSGEIRDPRALPTWLYRVTVRLAIDLLRRESLRRGVPLEHAAEAPDVDRTPSQKAADREGYENLRERLLSLPPRLRAVAVLRHLEGLSYRDIGEVLAIGAGTVKSRLYRAHQALGEVDTKN